MTSNLLKHVTLFVLASTFAYFQLVQGSDPDILSDFVVPSNVTNIDGNFFTFTGLRGIFDYGNSPINSNTTTKASIKEFPALNGQSVSLSMLLLPGGGISAPHTRPHATGLFFLLKGCLEVGFVDTTNKLYTQTLNAGDMFIFPKGLVHYQYNVDPKNPALGVAAFGSASAAVVSLPTTLFGAGIDDGILAESFKTDVATIKKIRAGLAPKR